MKRFTQQVTEPQWANFSVVNNVHEPSLTGSSVMVTSSTGAPSTSYRAADIR